MLTKRFLAIITLAGFAVICLIAFNLIQPTMDMGVHCTIHDYLIVSLGGSCDMSTKTFITFFEFVVVGMVVAGAFVCFIYTPFSENLSRCSCRRKQFLFNIFYLPLFEFYSNGTAPSRRFV